MRLALATIAIAGLGLTGCFVSEPVSSNADLEVQQVWASSTFYENDTPVDANALIYNNGPEAATMEVQTTMRSAINGADESSFGVMVERVELQPGEAYQLESSVSVPSTVVSECFWQVLTVSLGDPNPDNNVAVSDAFTLGSSN